MEVGLRWVAPPENTPGLFRKLDGSPMEWSGTPHARGVHFGVPVAFNSLGLRDAERSPAPEPGTVRILALGDSVTFGMGVPEADTSPRRLESLLNAAPGPRVEVRNMGTPGYNTLQELAQLREVGLGLRPDLVVVGYLGRCRRFAGTRHPQRRPARGFLGPGRHAILDSPHRWPSQCNLAPHHGQGARRVPRAARCAHRSRT